MDPLQAGNRGGQLAAHAPGMLGQDIFKGDFVVLQVEMAADVGDAQPPRGEKFFQFILQRNTVAPGDRDVEIAVLIDDRLQLLQEDQAE